MERPKDWLCHTRPLSSDGGAPGDVEHRGHSTEKRITDTKLVANRTVRRGRPPGKGPLTLPTGVLAKNDSDFLLAVRWLIKNYGIRLEKLDEKEMFEPGVQLDLSRTCVMEITRVLSMWKGWRKGRTQS